MLEQHSNVQGGETRASRRDNVSPPPEPVADPPPAGVAGALEPLVNTLFPGGLPIRLRCWDGTALGPPDAVATLTIVSPAALRRILWAPNELGIARAYVAGDIDIEGDLFAALARRDAIAAEDRSVSLDLGLVGVLRSWRAAQRVGAIGLPLPPPPEESRLRGRRHSRNRDAAAIAHHYDISNEFYRLVLGPTMTYSCGYFEEAQTTLEQAQLAKYDLIGRKLGLERGARLLDVGCGWGGMVMYAAERFGVEAVGVTVSERQAELARRRVADAGLGGRVTIRLQDYRDVDDGPFDAISSIGMFEHVGLARLGGYFATLFDLLRPGGRLLNHGISRPAGPGGVSRHSFFDRYVFPDGELHEVGTVVSAMQGEGFEVRDVESLREHYGRTLRAWVANLEGSWDAAEALVGRSRARIWRLYLSAAAVNFEAGRTSIHQVLAVRHDAGSSGMPATRRPWYGSPQLTLD